MAAGPARPFAGFTPAAYRFLIELGLNNAKPWFEANRAVYERAVKQPIAALITDASAELARRSLPLEGDPKRSTFRIHRDTRFSGDKSPYKTSTGAVWYRQGSSKDGAGVLYFHFAAEGCFVAAAYYRPEPEVLDAIRERIRVHPDRFQTMQADLAAAGLALDMADTLTRMPRGFEDLKDSQAAPALRLKSFLVRRDLPLEATTGPALVGAIVDLAEAALPLLQFGWAAVDEVASPSPGGRGSSNQQTGPLAPRVSANIGRSFTPIQLPASASAIQAQPDRLPAAMALK